LNIGKLKPQLSVVQVHKNLLKVKKFQTDQKGHQSENIIHQAGNKPLGVIQVKNTENIKIYGQDINPFGLKPKQEEQVSNKKSVYIGIGQ
jgi:hypothetical protein